MELRQLEQFVAVAEEHHSGRAAARCNVVPSAFSTSIRGLERELGVPLLRRTTRSVSLTEAGALFLAEARRCLAAAAAARSVVTDVRNLLAGSLRVGGIPTFDLLDQPALLQRIRREHPALAVRYTPGTTEHLIDAVRGGRLDVAVVSQPDPAPADLTVVEVATGPLVVACHRGHRLAGHTGVGPHELARESFVATPPGSQGRALIDRIFREAGREPDIPYEVTDVAAMLDFVETGLGVALVTDSLTAGRPDLRTVPIDEPSYTWTLAVIAPPTGQIPPAAEAFLDLLPQR
ncbi:LysR substrate-binding domain-containing protein [Actinoplanes sichuanensis]|uniref:LysR family transcriptional regulator n=1 Tax=Actinoplanes sichuanensis TaxID=512349 RepID=A0ABW4A6R3_9ACTN|nr:LysR family transcriptional regulator [Actinoplanes sichuanensis]BEL03318.1 LysR substrate-binding domain-containing protein [Actinoplanes sichuanensis]